MCTTGASRRFVPQPSLQDDHAFGLQLHRLQQRAWLWAVLLRMGTAAPGSLARTLQAHEPHLQWRDILGRRASARALARRLLVLREREDGLTTWGVE